MSTFRDQVQASLGTTYTLGEELGGGGMSRAFVAAETALGREVVVKVLPPELAAGISAERFLREIQLTARMQHPNIVPVLAAGESAGLPYYTMPYIKGASLRARLAQGPVPLAEAFAVLRDVARALAYAHEHGIVHRDVKPDNVLLSEGAGVVTDFGIAKAISDSRTEAGIASGGLTIAGTALGTPAYIAPEQAVGDDVDPRTDVYSWGVMAYEVLAGAHPFAERTSAQALIRAHVAEQPAPLATAAPHVSAALATLVDRCLEKDPALRPQNARALVEALDAATSSPSMTAALSPAARMRRRRTLWLTVAAALVILVAATALVVRARDAAAPLDAGLIAVLPFRVATADPSLQYLREGMVDLIGAQLVREPRTVDPRSTLAAWRRAGGSDDTDLENADAVRVAEALGAARVIQGDIMGSAERLTISAGVFAAPGGQQRARATATGAAAQLPVLLDSIMVKLLALDAGEGEQRAASLTRIPLPALREYLAGQAAYRHGRYEAAVERFARAIEIDSTFALAGLSLSTAAGWTFDERGERGMEVARAHAASLGTRDRELLASADAPRLVSTEAEVLARRERSVQVAPDVPELWYLLADRYFHWGAAVHGESEAYKRAAAGFERALMLDPTFAPALEHLPLLYAMRGDSARMRDAYARLARDTSGLFYQANRAVFAPTASERNEAVAAIRTGPAFVGVYATWLASATAETVELMPVLFAASQDRVSTELERIMRRGTDYMLAANGGQPARAARVAAESPELRDEFLVAATFWDGDSAAAATMHAAVLPRVRSGMPTGAHAARAQWVTEAFDLAQYELARGDTTNAPSVIAALRRVPTDSGSPAARARPGQLALILDAQMATLARRSDAQQRLAALDSMLALGPRGRRVAVAGNLVAARMLEAAGRPERAREAVDRWTAGTGELVGGFSTYVRERARLSAVLGDRESALRDYRLYLTLRRNAEPSLRAHLEGVRREVQRLETR